MRHTGRWRIALFLAVSGALGALTAFPAVHAAGEIYKVAAFPYYSQEGTIVTLLLSVSSATPLTPYQFVFNVTDPNNGRCSSNPIDHNTGSAETEFGLILAFPGPGFPSATCAPTSLVGYYHVTVDQKLPVSKPNVDPGVVFIIGITDRGSYQRTTTVSILATGYQPNESANVVIRTTSTPSTLILSDPVIATPSGQVTDSWKVPRNATVTTSTTTQYFVTVTGTATSKSPADAEIISVNPAAMSIAGLAASKPSYQRTETLELTFQAVYPDGSLASTGAALLTLTRPDRVNITLTATYDNARQLFVANYKTTATNQTGTWTASIAVNAFDDGWRNIGPNSVSTTTTQLQQATLSISISIKTYFVVNEQIKFNATIQYPDGFGFSSGTVYAFLSFSGGGYSYSVPVVYDTTLGLWQGAYSPNNAPGGLWSLRISAFDRAAPANTGSAMRTITLQDRTPVAIFTQSSTNVLTSVLVNFDGSASSDPDGTIISYSWTFGEGTTGSGHTVSHSYAAAGAYKVTLNVTDNSGSTAVASAVITVQDRPPTVSFSPSTNSTNTGSPVSFNAGGAADPDGLIVSYAWDFGDGSSGSGSSPSHTYSSPGTYTVKLTVTDNSGSTASSSSTVTIKAAPSSGGTASVPLYWFGIIVALIAAMLGGGFFYFRRHRVTHAKLKIDLEAVRSEAGRIESQEFFQSVKDQLKKDREN